MRHVLEIRLATVLSSLLGLALVVPASWADLAMEISNGRHKYGPATTRVPGPSNVEPDGDGIVIWAGRTKSGNPDTTSFYVSDATPSFSHRIYVSGRAAPDPPGSNNDVGHISVWPIGVGSSGGLGTSAFPGDTAYAGIGVYPDQPLQVRVDRSNPSEVTLTFPNSAVSGLQLSSPAGTRDRTEFRLLVYENDAAADADVGHDGAGAKFYGRVDFYGSGSGICLEPKGGFQSGDWFVDTSPGPGKNTARPAPSLTKTVPVLNSLDASIVLFGDAAVEQAPAVPGHSNIGLALLALALLGGGLWAIRRRRMAGAS
jgi:LPXTG-motif cell wall-anchored protein